MVMLPPLNTTARHNGSGTAATLLSVPSPVGKTKPFWRPMFASMRAPGTESGSQESFL